MQTELTMALQAKGARFFEGEREELKRREEEGFDPYLEWHPVLNRYRPGKIQNALYDDPYWLRPTSVHYDHMKGFGAPEADFRRFRPYLHQPDMSATSYRRAYNFTRTMDAESDDLLAQIQFHLKRVEELEKLRLKDASRGPQKD
jgi:hypothetical protein